MGGRLVLRPEWRSQRWLLTAFAAMAVVSPFAGAIGWPGTVLLDVAGGGLCLRSGLTLARARIIVDPVRVTVVPTAGRRTPVPRSEVDGIDSGRHGLMFTSQAGNRAVRGPRVWSVRQLLALAMELDVPLRVDGAKARVTVPAADEIPPVCDLILESAGSRKAAVIRAVRALTGLRAHEARRLVNFAPLPVLSGVDRETARAAIVRLVAEGATVRSESPLSLEGYQA